MFAKTRQQAVSFLSWLSIRIQEVVRLRHFSSSTTFLVNQQKPGGFALFFLPNDLKRTRLWWWQQKEGKTVQYIYLIIFQRENSRVSFTEIKTMTTTAVKWFDDDKICGYGVLLWLRFAVLLSVVRFCSCSSLSTRKSHESESWVFFFVCESHVVVVVTTETTSWVFPATQTLSTTMTNEQQRLASRVKNIASLSQRPSLLSFSNKRRLSSWQVMMSRMMKSWSIWWFTSRQEEEEQQSQTREVSQSVKQHRTPEKNSRKKSRGTRDKIKHWDGNEWHLSSTRTLEVALPAWLLEKAQEQRSLPSSRLGHVNNRENRRRKLEK